MKPVQLGIVGLGYWGPQWLRNFAGIDRCCVKYGCDVDPDRLRMCRKQYPAVTFTQHLTQILDDTEVEAVIIATPNSTHFTIAKAALEHGKHVLIEKPMTQTSQEAATLISLARKHKRMILVDHTFAYTAAVRKMQELIRMRKLGGLLYFDSTRINLGLVQKDTNVLWDLALHDLTILDALTKLDGLRELYACGSAHYGTHAEVGHLHLKFASGVHAHIHVSWLSPVKIRRTLIGGRRAMLVFDDTEPSEKIRLYDKGIDHDATKPDPFFPRYRSGDVLLPALPSTEALSTAAEHFLDCIQGKAKPLTSGEDGRRMVRLLELADKSLKEGKVIRIADL